MSENEEQKQFKDNNSEKTTDDESNEIANASVGLPDKKGQRKLKKITKKVIIVLFVFYILAAGGVYVYYYFSDTQGKRAQLILNNAEQVITVMNDHDFLILCGKGSLQQINDAIKNGANVNAKGNNEITPLMFAVMNNTNPEVFKALINAGADVNAKDIEGMTPIMFAAWYNSNPEVLTILINAGADINVANSSGKTPLMFAVKNNSNPEVMAALLQYGVNSKARDNSGNKALDYARGRIAIRNTHAFWELNDASR